MKLYLLLYLVTAVSCDKLNKASYLPPDAAAAGGAGAGLQAPFARPANAAQNNAARNIAAQYNTAGNNAAQYNAAENNAQYKAAQNSAAQAETLNYENEINEEGYHYAFETSDGTKAEQSGRVVPGVGPEEGSLRVTGSYSFVGDDGQVYSVTYTADERGYVASGAHLPTPPAPAAPPALPSLQLTSAAGAHYDSKRSSYDADAGY